MSLVDARPEPLRPVVRIVDPRRPDPGPPPAPGPPNSAGARRWTSAVAVVLAGLLVAVGAGKLHRAQVSARAVTAHAEGVASLRLDVVGARASLALPVQGAPVQDASVELLLRNDGPAPVRMLESQLDGQAPVSPGAGSVVAPGEVSVLSTVWRVRCQEVGGLAGPFFLDVRVQLTDGGLVPYRLDLQPVAAPDGPARAYRVAALRSCITLTPS